MTISFSFFFRAQNDVDHICRTFGKSSFFLLFCLLLSEKSRDVVSVNRLIGPMGLSVSIISPISGAIARDPGFETSSIRRDYAEPVSAPHRVQWHSPHLGHIVCTGIFLKRRRVYTRGQKVYLNPRPSFVARRHVSRTANVGSPIRFERVLRVIGAASSRLESTLHTNARCFFYLFYLSVFFPKSLLPR